MPIVPNDDSTDTAMLGPSARSDDLKHLRAFIAGNSHLALTIGVPFQVRLVIDTNVVLADLLWLAQGRKTPTARTALQEVIDSGTVIAFAPDWLGEEVEEHLPRLAREERIAEERLWQIWREYQPYIRFCAVPTWSPLGDQMVTDPDDLPFISLSVQISARAIVSRDWHISAMGAEVAEPEIMLHLRDYARATSIELMIKLGVHSVTIALAGSTQTLVHVAMALTRSFAQLPRWVQLTLLVGTSLAIFHPHSRTRLAKMLHKAGIVWDSAMVRLMPTLLESVQALRAEGAKAGAARQRAEHVLPPVRRTPLEAEAFAACLAAGTPLTLDEIAKRVRASGYISRSQDFDAYLTRVVRRSSRLVRGVDGRWSVAPAT